MGNKRSEEPKSAEQGGNEAKKGEKAKTKIWFDVVKGLKTENELETANSDKRGNELEIACSVRMFDSETESTEGRAEEREAEEAPIPHKGADKGHTSRQTDRKG